MAKIAAGVVIAICVLASAMSLATIAISQRQGLEEQRKQTCLLRASLLEARTLANVELARELQLKGEYYEDYGDYLDGAREECD